MADNINLLPEQTDVADGKSKQNKLINKICVAILVITIVAVAGVFGYNFILSQSIASLDNQAVEQKTEIDQYKEAEGLYRSAAMRLETANQFLAAQNQYSRALTELNKAIPGGVEFENLDIAADKSVTISGTATAYGELSGFVARLESAVDEQNAAYFIDPLLNTITRETQSTPIDFTLTFKLNNTLVVSQSGVQDL